MNNIVIRKSSGWEKEYGRYVVIDNNSLTMESADRLIDVVRLWLDKVKSYKNIERCCR